MKSRDVVLTAIFAAFSSMMEILPLDLKFPPFPRLTLDPTGIPLALAAYLYGGRIAAASTLVTAFVISMPRVGKPPNPIGALFKGLAELATVTGIAVSRCLWKGWKSMVCASVFVSVVVRCAVMAAANYVFLPIFFRIPQHVVLSLLWTITLFNIIQGLINVAGALPIYRAMKKAGYGLPG